MTSKALALVHVYYPEIWPDIAQWLKLCGAERLDVCVNVVQGRASELWVSSLNRELPGVRVFSSENRGLDMGGTLNLLRHVNLDEYALVLKLHTKRCDFNPAYGTWWRGELLRACFENVDEVFDVFRRSPEVSMIGSRHWLCHEGPGVNYDQTVRLCGRLGLDQRLAAAPFVGGSMFWCRAAVMNWLKHSGLRQEDFPEGHPGDGSPAHTVERLFGALAAAFGVLVGR